MGYVLKKGHKELHYKDRVLITVLSVFTFVTAIAAIRDTILANYGDAFVDSAVSLSALLATLYFRRYQNRVVAGSALFLMVALSTYYFTWVYEFDSNVLYLVITPVVALLVLPKRHAIASVVLYELGVAILLYFGYQHFTQSSYIFNSDAIFNFILASIFIFATWWFYNTTIEKTLQELAKLNREKEVLLQELHHRVKNNFNLIVSMLQMQYAHEGDLTNEAFVKSFKHRIESMALAHEQLYINGDISSVDLKEYIPMLSNNIVSGISSKSDVEIHFDIDSMRLEIDTLIYVGIMINEMLTNSLKYAKNQGKMEIDIRVEIDDEGGCVLFYSDSGTSSKEVVNSEGFGSMVIQMAAAQIEATLIQGDDYSYKVLFK